jgi:hypothetical protein
MLVTELGPEEFQPRSDAATCDFCREHRGVWISDPKGALIIPEANRTATKRTGSGVVEFHFCARCAEMTYAIYSDAAEAKRVAVARRDLFEPIAGAAKPVAVTKFENADVAAARARRLQNWTLVTTSSSQDAARLLER